MDIKTVNKITARLCGVDVATKTWGYKEGNQYYVNSDPWTISDPRCREIVREKFKLATYQHHEGAWLCTNPMHKIESFGKTIAEAEIACITAIAIEQEGSDE